jgi:hypothetical protein
MPSLLSWAYNTSESWFDFRKGAGASVFVYKKIQYALKCNDLGDQHFAKHSAA